MDMKGYTDERECWLVESKQTKRSCDIRQGSRLYRSSRCQGNGFTDRLALTIRWRKVCPCVRAPVAMLQRLATSRFATQTVFGMSRRLLTVVYVHVRSYVIGRNFPVW